MVVMCRKSSILLLVVLSFSCVYYNLFYNAKQNFKLAEENQRRSQINSRQQRSSMLAGSILFQEPSASMTERNLYKTAIDKANRVVVFHPESKYVDDALWIIGKSRYNMTEYITADKRFRELVIKYPDSKYVDDAYYYIGMSQFWLRSYDLALEAFSKVMKMRKSPYKDDAAYMIALMDFLQENYNSAITSFTDFLKSYPKSDSAALVQYCIGASYDSLGEYNMALMAYKNVTRYKPSHDLYFIARYAAGSAAFEADSVEMGLVIFRDLAKQERYFEQSSMIKLKIAEGLDLSGKYEEAINEYLRVIEQFPKTMESAEAYYRLGLIYRDDLYDLEKAKECFNNVAQEKRDSPFRNLALAHSAQISKLEMYKSKLGKTPETTDSGNVDSTGKLDSLAISDTTGHQPLDSVPPPDTSSIEGIPVHSVFSNLPESLVAGGLTFSDNLAGIIEPTLDSSSQVSVDTVVISDSSLSDADSGFAGDTVFAEEVIVDTSAQTATKDTSSLVENIETMFLLAELYYQDLNQPDSALSEYLLLADTYPESPYASKALLASACIYEQRKDSLKARGLYERIVNLYPSSPEAKYVADKYNDLVIPTKEDVAGLYTQAEDLYFVNNDVDSALALFEFIENRFPKSEFAAKSAFSRAWIIGNMLETDGDSSAYYAFSEVVEKYPETPYAEEAKIKMGLAKRERQEKRQQPEQLTEEEILTPEEDSLNRARADSLRRLAFTLPPAPAVKDTGEFLYPEHLLRLKFKGRVTFKIKIDLFGNVVDYQMLGPSGNADIDSVATEALLNTTFDVSNIQDLSKLDEYFRYEIRFEPPELDEFYNPYRDLEEKGP
ncbi:MAG: hypothetical protein DRP26_04190 [Candidatus Zixiibacteriota bacterium]|nr:MAG: hypothetical protein DRP26_04190 [candidate division Zixibacteria bacterium]